jgi:hypothetical protein
MHAVVLVGLIGEQVYLLDPAVDQTPVIISSADLLLAWSYFDYTYAVVTVEAA